MCVTELTSLCPLVWRDKGRPALLGLHGISVKQHPVWAPSFQRDVDQQEHIYSQRIVVARSLRHIGGKVKEQHICSGWETTLGCQIEDGRQFPPTVPRAACYVRPPTAFLLLVAQMVKRLPTIQETWVQSLGREDPLGREMATHSSTLAWKIPWKEEPGRLQPTESQRVGHNWTTSLSLFTHCILDSRLMPSFPPSSLPFS